MITAWFLYLYIEASNAGQYVVIPNIATEAECERIADEVFHQGKGERIPLFGSADDAPRVCFSYLVAAK